MSKRKSSPYIAQLYLRVGEQVQKVIERMVIEGRSLAKGAGPVGIVKRAITSQRYMVDFGNGAEPISYKDIIRFEERNR